MAQAPKGKRTGTVQQVESKDGGVQFEAVKEIEEETLKAIKSAKTFGLVSIGLIAYLIFLVMPDMTKKVNLVEKDLRSVLLQSEKFSRNARVFAMGSECAQCHLDPDFLLHNLTTQFPKFIDLKNYMGPEGKHKDYYTVAAPVDDDELMEIYRALK